MKTSSLLICSLAISQFDLVAGAWVVNANCNACTWRCPWYNLICKGYRGFCRTVAGATRTVVKQVNNACDGDSLNSQGQEIIQNANDLLVDRNIFEEEFVDSVNVVFCGALSNFNAGGLTPGPDWVWLDDAWLTADLSDVAMVLAHEYTHNKQYRRLGNWKFQCEYGEEVLSEKGTGRRNWIEREAYNFVDSVTTCIVNNTDCPTE